MFKINFNLERPKQSIKIQNIFNENMNFYICSSGGCGSTLLYNYLKNFGNTYHIHDRYPPDKLCYIGKENTNEDIYSEWFNKIEIPDDKLNNYKVIFIYRNPIEVIYSRMALPNGPNVNHLQNIKCNNNGKIYFGDVLKSKKDLYGLEEFFDNYTISKKRNYKIYCVKYEMLFNNIHILNKVLGIPDKKELYPTKQERRKKYDYLNDLYQIYASLIIKMNKMKFIEIINPLEENIINDDDCV